MTRLTDWIAAPLQPGDVQSLGNFLHAVLTGIIVGILAGVVVGFLLDFTVVIN